MPFRKKTAQERCGGEEEKASVSQVLILAVTRWRNSLRARERVSKVVRQTRVERREAYWTHPWSHFMSCHITLAAPYGTLTPLPFEAPIHSSNTMGLISIVNPMGSLFRITMLSGSIIRSQFWQAYEANMSIWDLCRILRECQERP